MTPEVSIVIVSWNTRALLADCLTSVCRSLTTYPYEVWVVDNGSTDGSQALVHKEFPECNLIANHSNQGFARANNQGIASSQGQFVLLLNSDAQLAPSALHSLVSLGEAVPRAGIIGARLVNPDGTFQASYTTFPGLWQEFLILSSLGRLIHGQAYPSQGPHTEAGPRCVDYVEGACMLARRQAIDDVGALDEGYFMYAEDVDWCYMMKAHGWQVWYQPEALVRHVGGASSRHRRPQREADLYCSRVRFFRKHYGRVAALCLTGLIYATTGLKVMLHRGLRAASHGRYGRPIVTLRDLVTSLRRA